MCLCSNVCAFECVCVSVGKLMYIQCAWVDWPVVAYMCAYPTDPVPSRPYQSLHALCGTFCCTHTYGYTGDIKINYYFMFMHIYVVHVCSLNARRRRELVCCVSRVRVCVCLFARWRLAVAFETLIHGIDIQPSSSPLSTPVNTALCRSH